MTEAKKVRFNPEDLIQEQIVGIDDALEQIERRMKPYAALNEKKQQLLSARRALLGVGNRTTGGTTTRMQLGDLLDYVKTNPGATPGAIAGHFGVTQTTISSHLYRNKDRFVKRDGQYWVRDPENGLDTEDDIDTYLGTADSDADDE
jgi:hypothetical protein